MGRPLLVLDSVSTYYGDARILAGLSLAIEAGETVCLLGRNGRGKTTTIKTILGLVPAREGRVVFDGTDITREPTHRIARHGIAWVPDNRRVFPTLSVERNLEMALNRAQPAAAGGDRWTLDRVYQRFPILARLRARGGEHLSGGEAQLVAIARALLMHPRLVLLDEPSQGLAPRIVEDIMAVIEEMRAERIAILLVEQNSAMALALADRACVIDDGRIVHTGSAAALAADTALTHRLLAV
jgi:branched-chain amino acid transport system ATP-binding protein